MIDMLGSNRVLDKVLVDAGTSSARTLEIYGVKDLSELLNTVFVIKSSTVGVAGNCTMKVNELAAKSMFVMDNGSTISMSDRWVTTNQLYMLTYNGSSFVAYPMGSSAGSSSDMPNVFDMDMFIALMGENHSVEDFEFYLTTFGLTLEGIVEAVQNNSIIRFVENRDSTSPFSYRSIVVSYSSVLISATNSGTLTLEWDMQSLSSEYNSSHKAIIVYFNSEDWSIQKFSLTDAYNSADQAYITVDTAIAENTDYTIPLKYPVGTNSLEVYYMGEKLIKGLHYIEVGPDNTISSTIQFKDLGQSIPVGRNIEFIVRK